MPIKIASVYNEKKRSCYTQTKMPYKHTNWRSPTHAPYTADSITIEKKTLHMCTTVECI